MDSRRNTNLEMTTTCKESEWVLHLLPPVQIPDIKSDTFMHKV